MARIPRPNFGKQKYFWLGILGSILIVLLLVGSSVYKVFGVGQDEVKAEFAQAAGLKAGDKVRVAGIEMGRVKGAEIAGDHVVATLQVSDDVKLGPDAKASIRTVSILGGTYVDLDPGDGSGLPDDRIPLSNTSVPFNLAKIVEDPKYQSQFSRIEDIDTKKVAEAITVMGQQLGDSPKLTAQALDSVGVLAKVIDSRRAEVDGLLKNLDQVTAVLNENRNNILLIMANAGAIGDRVLERRDLVEGLLRNVATLSSQLQEIGGENNGQLGPMLDQLSTMSEGLEKNREQLDKLLQIMPVTLRQIGNTWGGDGDYAQVWLPWGLFNDRMLCGVPGVTIIEGCR